MNFNESKFIFKKGRYYESFIHQKLPNFVPMSTEGHSLFYFNKNDSGSNFKFEDYFYTLAEIRKLKLQKLNGQEILDG